MDEKLSLTEAQAVPVFGEYFLNNVPEGYREENIRRYKDKWNDYLSACGPRVTVIFHARCFSTRKKMLCG